MDFFFTSESDTGTTRSSNEDNLYVEQFVGSCGNVVFAVLCDGMGGLSHGERASASLVSAFYRWAHSELPVLLESQPEDHVIRSQWTALIAEQNRELRRAGALGGFRLGSTATAILLTESRYYILNIGDTRAYELRDGARQLTEDHTVLVEELQVREMTEKEQLNLPQRNALTRCVGVEEHAYPDLFFGDTRSGSVYILCSDGFRHCVTEEEIYRELYPRSSDVSAALAVGQHALIELNKQRGETDNISVISICAL